MNKPRQIRRSCCGVDFLLQVGCAVISGTGGSGLPLEAHCGSGRQTRKLLTASSRQLEAAAVTVQATVQLRADRIAGNNQQVDQKAARADLRDWRTKSGTHPETRSKANRAAQCQRDLFS
jgi:hypothetical protein